MNDAEQLDQAAQKLAAVVNNPPAHLRPLAAAYRNAIARRQAIAQRSSDLQAELQRIEAQRYASLGAERALHEALTAMLAADPKAKKAVAVDDAVEKVEECIPPVPTPQEAT